MRFQKSYTFRCRRKRIYRFASTRYNFTWWRKLNSMRMLLTHAPAIFSVTLFILMRFGAYIIIRYVCVFVLIHLQEGFQIGAFSMKLLSVLVWTEGLNASKWTRSLTETRLCGRSLNLVFCDGYLVRQSSIHVWRGSQAVSVRRIFWPVFCIPGFFRGKKTLFDNEVINSQSFSSSKKIPKIKLLSKYENLS